jgi:hypothetical protein
MGRLLRFLIIATIGVGILVGGYFAWDWQTRVSDEELASVVQRDGLPFAGDTIPDELLDRLATNRVVLVGEFHFLREHRDLMTSLLWELYGRGFRQYLFEWTQAADWLLADYVNDGGLEPTWTPPHDIGGTALTAIRDFNRTVSDDERIRVHAVDVHLSDYGGTEGWLTVLGLLAKHLPDPGPIPAFLESDHETGESHQAQLEALQVQLHDRRAELVASWGAPLYGTVSEMVEVELRSIAVRDLRESDYDESVRLREQTIKWLSDRRIAENPGGTLINFGSTHAQKTDLVGTENIEWLGDYLVHRSPVASGSTISLLVAPSHIVSVPGSNVPDFDLSASPANELLRVVGPAWPDKIVFMPLDDALFHAGRVPVNFSGEIYVSAPQTQYDALILLPIAHRDFVGD